MPVDLVWGRELRKKYPKLFSISGMLAVSGSRTPNHGEVWDGFPEHCLLTLYENGGDRECPGTVINGQWLVADPPPPGPQVYKIYFSRGNPPPTLFPAPRPGLVLGDPCTQGWADDETEPTVIDWLTRKHGAWLSQYAASAVCSSDHPQHHHRSLC